MHGERLHSPCRHGDSGVAELIGTVILITIFVAAVALIAVTVFSQAPPQKIPSVNARFATDNSLITVYHNGGDPIEAGYYRVSVNGNLLPAGAVIKSPSSSGNWQIGETLTVALDGVTPSSYIQLLYLDGARSAILASNGTPQGGGASGPTQAPTAAFSSGVSSGTVPLPVQFVDLSTNNPTSWSWSFGDGGTSTERNPVHTFTSPGTFTVTLTVQNSYGSSSTSRTIVTTMSVPVVAFTGTPLSGTSPVNVQFTDLSTGNPTSWSWNFGDGNTTNATVKNPLHTYTISGNFTVTLTATNAGGSNATTREGYISVITPVSGTVLLNAEKGAYLEPGGAFQFRVNGDISTITINGATYSLNDGETVRLVTDNTAYGTVYSTSTAITTFSVSNISLYRNGAYVNSGSVSSIYVSSYDQPQSTLNLYMPYATAWTDLKVNGVSIIYGTDDRAVRILGVNGSTNLVTSPTGVYYDGTPSGYQVLSQSGPQVTGISPATGSSGSTVSITNLSGHNFATSPAPSVRLQKGTTSINATAISAVSSSQIQCTFNLAGAETGSWDVVVTNPDGQYGTGAGLFTVTPEVLAANFTYTPSGLAVQFTDASTGSPTAWDWDFGDGTTHSTLQAPPPHTYAAAGSYTVVLTVTKGAATSTVQKTILVTVPGAYTVSLNAGKATYVESGGEIQFRVTGLYSSVAVDGVTYALNQGDTVRLVMEGNEYGSIYSSATSLTTFSFGNVSFYQNGVFKARGTVGSTYVSTFDQMHSTLNLFMPSASAWTTFSVNGTPIISGEDASALRISGLSGAMNLAAGPATSTYNGGASGYQIVLPPAPQVTGITPASGMTGTTVSITDLAGSNFDTTSPPTVQLRKGPAILTATSVAVLSSSRIKCNISLAGTETGAWDVVVTNPDGQSGTGTGLFTITPGPLAASFTYTLPSPNIVRLTDTSTGGATTWDWDFGDGTPHSYVQNPPDHTYAAGGNYLVSLSVTGGGQSSSTQQTIPVFLPATHTALLNAGKNAYVESGGVMQFHVTGSYSTITVNGVSYTLNQGDTVRLVMESNGYGSISSSASSITTFSFDDISFYQNGVYKNRGTVSSIYVSGYDTYQSTLSLSMPSVSGWTAFSFDGASLINGESTSAVRLSGLGGAMGLTAAPNQVYYTGKAAGYTMS